VETIQGAKRVALFTSLYAGSLSGMLALLALFLIGFNLITLASGQGVAGSVIVLDAFRFFNLLALLGGLVGSLLAARHDFSGGALGVYKSTLAAVNLLVVPLVLVVQSGETAMALWVAFLSGALMSSINLVALLFCQYRIGRDTFYTALRYTGVFAGGLLVGAALERFAFASSTLLLHFVGHGLLLLGGASAAFYALAVAREVWEPLQADRGAEDA